MKFVNNFSFRNLVSAVLVCFSFSCARAWDPNKPFIYEMRIAFETDNWTNHYSTTTVLSKNDNSEAFRVVAYSTTAPTYQLVVTTQGNVGISTGNPTEKLEVAGTIYSSSGGVKFPDGTTQTSAAVLPSSPQEGDILYYTNGAWARLALGSAGQSLKIGEGGIDSYTKLLLHLDDNVTDAATGKTVTNTNVAFNNSGYKFGGYSGYFNGSAYLSAADSNDWYFGSDDFTIDLWAYYYDYTSNQNFASQYQDSNNRWQFESNGSQLHFYWLYGGSILIDWAASWVASVNTWYHIALVRQGSNFTFYVNGTSIGSTTASAALGHIAAPLYIGVKGDLSGQYIKGYVDEYRLSNGIARWTSNFTPPAAPYGTGVGLLWSY